MKTSIVLKNLPRGVTRPTQVVPVVPDDAELMPGSEDITVRRDIPARSPNDKAHKALAFTANVPFRHLLAGVMLASVVACGTTSGDRMVSGAGIGAGAGAVLGAVTGMGPGTGAAIGAAAGAATGGLTKKKQINLGKPVWR